MKKKIFVFSIILLMITFAAYAEGTWVCSSCGERVFSMMGDYCPYCGEHHHQWKPATCTEAESCACGEMRGEPLGHDWREASCKVPKTCLKCGTTEGPLGEHSWNKGVVIVEATCMSSGEIQYTCTVCGEKHNETIPSDLANHTGAEEVQNQKEATCTEAGYTGDSYCKSCGKIIETGKTIQAKGHSWTESHLNNGIRSCSICGIENIDDFKSLYDYSESKNKITIDKYKGNEKVVNIPKSINGKEITAIGSNAFRMCRTLTSVIIPNGVTSIGSAVFYNCSSLTSVTVSNGVTSIGDYAFYNCSSLTSVTFPSSVKSIGDAVFYNCRNLKSITIPNGVTSIGIYAFYNCNSLASVSIPNSVTSIKNLAFYNCSNLKNIIIPTSVTFVGNNAFSHCRGLTSIIIPENVTFIGEMAFLNCTSLTSVTIPRNVTEIGKNAFDKCSTNLVISVKESSYAFDYCKNNNLKYKTESNKEVQLTSDNTVSSGACGENLNWTLNKSGVLSISGTGKMKDYSYNEQPWASWKSSITSVVIGDKVTSIGAHAFDDYYSLGDVLIPESVTQIGERAFWCTGLKRISVSANVTKIGFGAFVACRNLATIEVSAKNNYYTSVDGILYDKKKETLYTCPGARTRDVTVPNDVKTIAYAAFRDCSQIKQIKLPETLKTIGNECFWNCNQMGNISIPASVTSIGGNAFSYCRSMTSLSIPSSVKSIGNNAFYNCSSKLVIHVTSGSYAEKYCKENKHNYQISDGNTASNTAAPKATVKSTATPASIKITSQPKNMTAAVGEYTEFTIKATGSGLSYSWQYRTTTDTTWRGANIICANATTSVLRVRALSRYFGYQFRCRLTDGYGNIVYSNTAYLKKGSKLSSINTNSKKIEIGNYIKLGSYPQSTSGNDQTPIEWQVLDIWGQKALLISRYCLDAQSYNTKSGNTTWEKCTLRAWLNKDFYYSAFSYEERKIIQTTTIDNSKSQGYSKWNTLGGNDTKDKVFLLSFKEANTYFGLEIDDENHSVINQLARAGATAYAISKGGDATYKWKTEDGVWGGWWWLRSPGDRQEYAANVLALGALWYVNTDAPSRLVRPAMWINIDGFKSLISEQ